MNPIDRSRCATRVLACAALFACAGGHAAQWRSATPADVPGAWHAPLKMAQTAAPAEVVGAGQVMILDPGAPKTLSRRPAKVDLRLRTGPTGDVYIDTRGLHETATAVLAADGSVHVDCGHAADDPSHLAPAEAHR